MGDEVLPRVVRSQVKNGWLAFTRSGYVVSDDGGRFIYFRTEKEAWKAIAEYDKVRQLQFHTCPTGLVSVR